MDHGLRLDFQQAGNVDDWVLKYATGQLPTFVSELTVGSWIYEEL